VALIRDPFQEEEHDDDDDDLDEELDDEARYTLLGEVLNLNQPGCHDACVCGWSSHP